MFIDGTYLFYIDEVDRIVANNYANNGSIIRLDAKADGQGYHITAVLKVGYNLYHPDFRILPHGVIDKTYCDCHWYKPDKLCAHIGACLHHLFGRDLFGEGYTYEAKKAQRESMRDINNSDLSYYNRMLIEKGKMQRYAKKKRTKNISPGFRPAVINIFVETNVVPQITTITNANIWGKWFLTTFIEEPSLYISAFILPTTF